MRILGTIADDSGCGYYRIALPLAELNVGRGHRTRVTNYLTNNLVDELYEDVDVLMVQRICDGSLVDWLIDVWQGELGKPLVYELDDLVTDLHHTNWMARRYYDEQDRLEHIKRIMVAADMVTTTTDTLAGELEAYNQMVAVLPNCVPNWAADLGQYRQDFDGPLRVTYAGGNSHVPDVQHYQYAWKQLRRLHTEGRIWFVLVGTDWREEMSFPEAGWMRWVTDFVIHQQRLINFDVGLAPLVNNRFNRSKSPIKILEYWAAGVIPVASDLGPDGPYAMIRNGEDGFLVNRESEWAQVIRYLADNPDVVEKIRQAGYERAREYTIANQAERWEQALGDVIA